MCESVCVSEEQGKPILYGNEISKTLHRSPVWCLSVCVCVQSCSFAGKVYLLCLRHILQEQQRSCVAMDQHTCRCVCVHLYKCARLHVWCA